MRRPFEMFHGTICALKRISGQMAMGQVNVEGSDTSIRPGTLPRDASAYQSGVNILAICLLKE
ncbi:hypothetical protein ACJA3S_20520 [Pseudomonas sp. KnCO4]|uniref:hypothetical protein n=1 Tax=Pseudomonas sp. KnCO4 TaxID=3381355 RepID=UPI003877B3C7